MRVITSCASIE
jgi:hypothetical protein